jgi:hypothetical protein
MVAGSSTQDDAGTFLNQCVAEYNTGVRKRDFSGLLALLTDDAVLDFEGTSQRGPFIGKAAIAQHFADDPPEDPITLKRWKAQTAEIVAEFAWTDIPEGGGCLILQRRAGRLSRITLALGGPRCAFR